MRDGGGPAPSQELRRAGLPQRRVEKRFDHICQPVVLQVLTTALGCQPATVEATANGQSIDPTEATQLPGQPMRVSRRPLRSSWGSCEPFNDPNLAAASENLLAALATSGVTTFAASGDDGADDCRDVTFDPAVDYPASSPYVV